MVPVSICGKKSLFSIDTGLNDALSINSARVSYQSCAGPVHSDLTGTGLGGRHIHEIIGISSIQLGSNAFSGVVAGLEGRDDPLVAIGIDGSIGYNLLRRSNFVLDAGAGVLRFYGPYRFDSGAKRPTIGIQFSDSPDVLTITHLMSNSPASRAGIQEGDRICAIGSKTITDWKGAYSLRPAAGTKVSIGLCNGRTLQIVADDFLATPPMRVIPPSAGPEPAGIGDLTAAFSRCQANHNLDALKACSNVIASPRIAPFYRSQAQTLQQTLTDSLTHNAKPHS